MSEPWKTYDLWAEVRHLLTAIDSHRLVTDNPTHEDELLYLKADQTRIRLN